jgi:hypothetical protein
MFSHAIREDGCRVAATGYQSAADRLLRREIRMKVTPQNPRFHPFSDVKARLRHILFG